MTGFIIEFTFAGNEQVKLYLDSNEAVEALFDLLEEHGRKRNILPPKATVYEVKFDSKEEMLAELKPFFEKLNS